MYVKCSTHIFRVQFDKCTPPTTSTPSAAGASISWERTVGAGSGFLRGARRFWNSEGKERAVRVLLLVALPTQRGG